MATSQDCLLSVSCYPNNDLAATSLWIDPTAETGRSLALRLFWQPDATFGSLMQHSVDSDDLFTSWLLCTPDRVPLRSQTRPLARVLPIGAALSLCFVNFDASFDLTYVTSGCPAGRPLSVAVTTRTLFGELVEKICRSLCQTHEIVSFCRDGLKFDAELHLSSTLLQVGIGAASGFEFVVASHMPARKGACVMYTHILNMYMPGAYIPFVIYYDPNLHTPRQLIVHTRSMMLARRNCCIPAKVDKALGVRIVSQTIGHKQSLLEIVGGRGDLPFSGWPVMRDIVSLHQTPAMRLEWKNRK